MKYIYLPGNGVINKTELDSFSKMFKARGADFYAHEYAHWKDEALSFDMERELSTILSAVGEVKEYSVLGKSIGTYVAVELIEKLGLSPKLVVLMGIPTGIGQEKTKRYLEVLKKVQSKIILIQNDNDPYGPLEKVRDIMQGVDFKEKIMPAENHIYMYADLVKELIKKN